MVTDSEIRKYLKEKPGSTVDDLNLRHYSKKHANDAGYSHISFTLFYMIVVGEVRCELVKPGYMMTRFFLTDPDKEIDHPRQPGSKLPL